MPYICKIRADIPDATLQLVELQPNTSQRNLIYDPEPQTKYPRRPDHDAILLQGTGPITTVRAYDGLAAYLVDRIEDTLGTEALTAAEANTIATALIARMDAGLVMALANINAVIQATVAGAGIGIGNSTGTVADVLEILAGGVYHLPAGSQVEDAANNFDATVRGSMTHVRHTYTHGAFNISRAEGRLSVYTDPTYEYGGVAGAALLLYADDGTLL